MKVLYWGPRRRPEAEEREAGITYVTLEELLAQSDFVSLHSPLTPETRHQIGAREFALMKPSAYFINTARGPIVDELAMIRALKNRTIAGAGLDVFENEPHVPPELCAMPNVVLTPHLGSAVVELREVMANIVADNAIAILEGRKPPNCWNPQIYAT
jgi:glyoxylate reductase